MSEFKFACPACGQRIAGDVSWAGAQIKCPVCQSEMMVPKPEPSPAPPPPAPVAPTASSSPMRLSMSPPPAAPAHAHQPVAPPPPVPAGRKLPLPNYLQAEKKEGKARTLITVAILIAVVVVAGVLLMPLINRAQDKMNESRKKEAEEAGGGQVGHIMELNNVLDATDPFRGQKEPDRPKKQLPAPPWSLEADAAKIPSGNVRGKVMAAAFDSQDASIEITGQAYVLTFRQFVPPREMIVSLRLKPGENIQDKKWAITKETTAGAPGVAKKWRTDRDSPPNRAAYASGYSMKLEFGKSSVDGIDGKIYLALPDTEQSVIAGEFRADVRMADGSRPRRPGMSAFDE